MSLDVQPPYNDDETTRHKFYVAITAALDNNTAAMNRIGEKLDEINSRNDIVTKEFNEFRTKIESSFHVFIRGTTLLAAVLGSSLLFMFQQGYTYFDRVDKLERKVIEAEIVFRNHVNLPDQIQAIKSRISDMENEHANLKEKK